MDRLQSMRTFVRVVDEQGFAAAARALDVAPAVVTRLVADLEAHLGVRLLQRSTRRLALTGAGEQYLARARAILDDIDEAEALASTSALQPSGRVRVLVPPAFSFHQIVKHLPHFSEQYPGISIDMTSSGVLEVADEGYDVSVLIARGELEQGDFVAHRLATSHLVMCASAAYLKRHGSPAEPDELPKHRCLVVNTPGGGKAWTMRQAGERTTDAAPEGVLSAQHADTLYGAALAGLGIAALPSFIVGDALAAGRLVRVLPDWSLASLTVYAAMPTRKYVPARTRAFVDFLVATFASPGDPWLA
jgi:DNA-binding transcriptional LysR family regulator